jgi:aminoglycoside phosphotransferase (APT) family kinase protein
VRSHTDDPGERPKWVRLHPDEVPIDDELVRALLAEQFPSWSSLPLERLRTTGTDNAIFRLGDRLGLRLPRIHWAVTQIEKEWAWLRRLEPLLPVELPVPEAKGEPAGDYPFPWLVFQWVAGSDLQHDASPRDALGVEIGTIVRALHRVELPDSPAAARRGHALSAVDDVARWAIGRLGGVIDTDRALEAWEAAVGADPWSGPPVWVHGDLLPGNLLIRDGRLCGVIDWSAAGVGDPACDAMIAWALPEGARSAFRSAVDFDDATWARARGWVIEQTALFIPYYEHTIPDAVAAAKERLQAALADEDGAVAAT